MKLFIAVIVIVFSVSVQAWDGTISGKISRIDVTSGNNYGIRVYLESHPKLCGTNSSWAYLNESNSNYQTYVSVLLAAKMSDSKVTIYSNASSGGYCEIGYLVL